jgi:hypothetical protein
MLGFFLAIIIFAFLKLKKSFKKYKKLILKIFVVGIVFI